jgi:hypothetical protein
MEENDGARAERSKLAEADDFDFKKM